MGDTIKDVGVVVIGRNEGQRLKRCLQSLLSHTDKIVYVDSGSSDHSAEYAESIGIGVIRLDMRAPFSAGRSRNEGFEWLVARYSHIEFIQFVDGDCKLSDGWLSFAHAFLKDNARYAIVTGRRKEEFPDKSVYNRLCDIEWNTPVGDVKSCGGDFMVRRHAYQQVQGFNPSVIAGEEPELCYRLVEKGWKIFRLDHQMTLHDAAITRFFQWWRRAVRGGHAYAQGYAMHGRDGKGYCRNETIKIWLYALIFPISILISVIIVSKSLIILLFVYVLQFCRIMKGVNNRLKNPAQSALYAVFTIISRWPQLMGQIIFLYRRINKKKFMVIEYQ